MGLAAVRAPDPKLVEVLHDKARQPVIDPGHMSGAHAIGLTGVIELPGESVAELPPVLQVDPGTPAQLEHREDVLTSSGAASAIPSLASRVLAHVLGTRRACGAPEVAVALGVSRARAASEFHRHVTRGKLAKVGPGLFGPLASPQAVVYAPGPPALTPDEQLVAAVEAVEDAPASPWDPESDDQPPPSSETKPASPAVRRTTQERALERTETERLKTGFYLEERRIGTYGHELDDDEPPASRDARVTPTEPSPRPRVTPTSRRRLALVEPSAPQTRGDCIDGPRPCPWRACRYHLGDAPQTCTLDLADRDGQTLDQVAQVFGLTRERIRQIESKALKKLAKKVPPELRDGIEQLNKSSEAS